MLQFLFSVILQDFNCFYSLYNILMWIDSISSVVQHILCTTFCFLCDTSRYLISSIYHTIISFFCVMQIIFILFLFFVNDVMIFELIYLTFFCLDLKFCYIDILNRTIFLFYSYKSNQKYAFNYSMIEEKKIYKFSTFS